MHAWRAAWRIVRPICADRGEASCPKCGKPCAGDDAVGGPGSRFTAFLEAVRIDRPNEAAESMHAWIQRIKRMACGSRNRVRFRPAIIFHLAGPDFHPRPV
jgi:hypothetical protein